MIQFFLQDRTELCGKECGRCCVRTGLRWVCQRRGQQSGDAVDCRQKMSYRKAGAAPPSRLSSIKPIASCAASAQGSGDGALHRQRSLEKRHREYFAEYFVQLEGVHEEGCLRKHTLRLFAGRIIVGQVFIVDRTGSATWDWSEISLDRLNAMLTIHILSEC